MHQRLLVLLCTSFIMSTCLPSCYRMRASKGDGQIHNVSERVIRAADRALPSGSRREPVASRFAFFTGAAFDDAGNLYVIEAGYAYGGVWGAPRLLRVDNGGKTAAIAYGTKNGPLDRDLLARRGFLCSRRRGDGRCENIGNHPGPSDYAAHFGASFGDDHHTCGPTIKEGYLFTQTVVSHASDGK